MILVIYSWNDSLMNFLIPNFLNLTKIPSQFSKSIGFTLWGIVEDPTSFSLIFYKKYPIEIYYHISYEKPIKIVLIRCSLE